MAGRSGTGSSIRENFEAFFNGWVIRQENYLQQLVQALTSQQLVQALTSQDEHETERLGSLIEEVLSHYQQYLEEKTRAAKEEVYLFYSPPWLSSFEKTQLWVGGFKPLILFKLLANSVTELTPEQEETIGRIKQETRKEELELTEAMAAIQEGMATPPLLNLFRRFGRLVDGEVFEFESAMETLKAGLLRTLERADKLRCSTVKKVVEVLNPIQTVKFLAASAEFQLRVRRWGSEKDQQRATVILG